MATGKAESADGGIPHGALLRGFAEAILDRRQDVDRARNTLVEALGEDATVQAASIVASFDGINRVADATGIRLDPETASRGADHIIEALEFEKLGAART
jgi:predicted RNA-binding protein with PIN domain